MLCAKEITVLGHHCTMEGRLPDGSRVAKIVNWGSCKDLTDVHAFLGTIGICRLFIKNFSHCTHHLVKLTRKAAPWELGQDQISAVEDLKQALLLSPALDQLIMPLQLLLSFQLTLHRLQLVLYYLNATWMIPNIDTMHNLVPSPLMTERPSSLNQNSSSMVSTVLCNLSSFI